MTSARIHWIDNLRGLAMFAIFMGHASASYVLGFYEPWPFYDRYADHQYLIVLLYLQSLLPPLFFFIAGFLAAKALETQNYITYCRKRLWRLGGPFLIGMILFIFPSEFLYFVSRIFPTSFWQQQTHFPPTQIWQNITVVLSHYDTRTLLQYFDNTQVYWFLFYLLLIECLAPLAKKGVTLSHFFSKEIREQHARLLFYYGGFPTLLACLYGLLLPAPPHLSIATPTSIMPDFTAFIEFFTLYCFGMAASIYPRFLTQLTLNFDLKILFGIFIGFTFFYFGYALPETYVNPFIAKLTWCFYNVFFWFTILGTIGGFFVHYDHTQKTLRYLSDAAYWIYFIHLPLIIPIQSYFSDKSLNPIFKYPLMLLCATAIVILPYHLFLRKHFLNHEASA